MESGSKRTQRDNTWPFKLSVVAQIEKKQTNRQRGKADRVEDPPDQTPKQPQMVVESTLTGAPANGAGP